MQRNHCSGCHVEAFSYDYDLPNDTAYAETCASVGLVFSFFSNQLRDVVFQSLPECCHSKFNCEIQQSLSGSLSNAFFIKNLNAALEGVVCFLA